MHVQSYWLHLWLGLALSPRHVVAQSGPKHVSLLISNISSRANEGGGGEGA